MDTLDKKEVARLNTILGKAILIVWGMELDISNVQGLLRFLRIYLKGWILEALKALPKDRIDELRAMIDEQVDRMPVSMITQSSINFISLEYEAIGVDIHK